MRNVAVWIIAAISLAQAQDKSPNTVVTEGVVEAPVSELWRVFTTSDGYKNLGVAQAEVDFRAGGTIRTHYDPKGVLGDDGTIVTEILTFDPGHVITTRIQRPPKNFPFMTAYKSVWNVISLTDLGGNRTNLRTVMAGFDASSESQAMRAFFERGNASVLEELRGHYTTKPATGKLEAFAALVGRDWTAPLPNGEVTDTQRFEWMYGHNFLRNTHWVKTKLGETVYEGETVYAWDARAKRIVWWYWNTTGGFLEGTADIALDGTITAEGVNHGSDTQLERSRSSMRIGTNEWVFTPFAEKDGKWAEQPERTYR